jgi:hypothetical protein
MTDTPVKIDTRRVLNELLMARTQCLALVRNIELLLLDLGVMTPSDGIDRLRVPVDPADSDEGPCRHPYGARRRAPVMGHSDRFVCSSCGEVVNGDEEV